MKNILFIAVIIFFASCEKTIKVTLPHHESKIVVESNTYTNEAFRFKLSKSMPALSYQNGKDYTVKDAVIVLQENNVAIDTLYYNEPGQDYPSSYKAQEGKTYSIKVTAPGLPEATANTVVPSTVVIKDIKRIHEARVNRDGVVQDEIRITFDDPATHGDFYIVKINGAYNGGGMVDCINTSDASVESLTDEGLELDACISGDGIFMRDLLFNGTSKELRLFANSYYMAPWTDGQGNTIYPTIELYHVTEDCFKHVKSYRFASDNNGNPFAEPTNVHTNLSNGYGIFTIWSRDQKEIK